MLPLEIAAGVCFGHDTSVATRLRSLQKTSRGSSPFDALCASIRRTASPVEFVEFSGGLDSSLVLACATFVARESGQPDPVPVTLRFADHAETDETDFQVAVHGHLRLRNWVLIEVDDELDLLGPASCEELASHGIAVAARIPARAWMLRQLGGTGTLLSGEGGDEVLGAGPLGAVHFARIAFRERRYRRPAIRWLGASASRPFQTWQRRSQYTSSAWLTATAERQVSHELKTTMGGSGFSMDSLHRHHRSKRYITLTLDEVSSQAARHGLAYSAPLLDLQFMAELVRSVPDSDFVNRNLFLQRHFGGLLPTKILRRTTKAKFKNAVYGPATRSFAERWDGTGVPSDLVDPARLRQAWIDGSDARSSLLLHQAWLASEGLA